MAYFTRVMTALSAAILLSVTLLGCNTFSGAGKDIQKGGKSVENAAEGAKRN
jgi:predicted small secreted protein